MVACVADMELQLLESMSREQVLAMLEQRQQCLPPAMSTAWRVQQSTCGLRMLLLAAKLIDASWHLDVGQAASR